MSPDSPESRIGRLEQSVAKLEQRTQDHEVDIRAFAPMTASHAVLTEQMLNLQKTQSTILARLDAQDAQAERNRSDERRDARNARLALYGGMLLVVLTTLGGFLVNLLTQAP